MLKNRGTNQQRQDEAAAALLFAVWLYRIALIITMLAGITMFDIMPGGFLTSGMLIVAGVYLVLLVSLHKTYDACEIGRRRIPDLLMSQLLTNVICAAATYLLVTLLKNSFLNPLGLFLVIALQTLISVFWTVWANGRFFKELKCPRTVVFYQNDFDLEMLFQTYDFQKRYQIVRQIRCSAAADEKLDRLLEDCENVFAVGLPVVMTDALAKLCLKKNILFYFTPELGSLITAGAQYRSNFAMPLLCAQRRGKYSEYGFFKRLIDLAAALLGIVIASPIMLLTAAAIWLEDRGPVLYRQVRLTRNGKEFQILKFRSMFVNAEQDGVARLATVDDERITRVGKFIRTVRFDELPQLFNILAGDMSVVGPRPERPEIARAYEETIPEFPLRLQVKAGLTGMAQVYGRYNTDPYHKLQMDLMYINDMSFPRDMQLILATIKILFLKQSTQGVDSGKTTAISGDSQPGKSA